MGRRLIYIISILFAVVGIYIAVNLGEVSEIEFIPLDSVEGIELYRADVPYTLNFEQQNEFLNQLNSSKGIVEPQVSLVEWKLTVWRFEEPKLEVHLFSKKEGGWHVLIDQGFGENPMWRKMEEESLNSLFVEASRP